MKALASGATPSQRVLAKMAKELPAILTEPPEVDKTPEKPPSR